METASKLVLPDGALVSARAVRSGGRNVTGV